MNVFYKHNDEYIKMSIKSFFNIINYNEILLTKSFKNSLRKKLKISIDEYLKSEFSKKIEKCGICGYYAYYDLKYIFGNYKKYPLIIDVEIIYSKNFYCKGKNENCKGKNINPNSVEFVSLTRNINSKEALKLIHERNKSPFYIENHQNIDEYKKYQSRDINFFKNNEIEYNKFKNKISYANSRQRYIDVYGEKEGTYIFDRISQNKDTSSLNYFLNKNKNNLKKSLKEFEEKNNKTKQTLENFIKRHGDKEGKLKYSSYNKKRKENVTLKGFIERYGFEKGIYKRNEFLNKILFKNNFYSKESYNIFTEVDNLLNINGLYGENEYFLRNNNNSVYFYDYVLLEKKKIIEYNGKLWHPDKNIFTEEEWNSWKHPFNNKIKAIDIYNKDIDKIKIAKDSGFDVLVVWDFEDNKLEKIINFIKND